MKSLGDLGERNVIQRLTEGLPTRPDVGVGVGDDTAVVRPEGSSYELLLTSDPLVEGVHFAPGADPRAVGHKAIGRVLSDVAAMGGEPLWALVNVAAPATLPMDWMQAVYAGAAALADRYGLAIVGGDMTASDSFQLHVFAAGRVPVGAAVLRSGARPGDGIYVTGSLGGSRSGKHLAFEPRIAEGCWLREEGWASAMIDVTDGLARDLRHLLERSEVGADLNCADLPLSEAARAATDERTPLEHGLRDGEDFELLFTVPADRRHLFESAWADTFELSCTRVGCINSDHRLLTCVDEEGTRSVYGGEGYEHFR